MFNASGEPLGPVAQLVEQRIENPRVGGSIPPQATKSQAPDPTGQGLFSCRRAARTGGRGPHAPSVLAPKPSSAHPAVRRASRRAVWAVQPVETRSPAQGSPWGRGVSHAGVRRRRHTVRLPQSGGRLGARGVSGGQLLDRRFDVDEPAGRNLSSLAFFGRHRPAFSGLLREAFFWPLPHRIAACGCYLQGSPASARARGRAAWVLLFRLTTTAAWAFGRVCPCEVTAQHGAPGVMFQESPSRVGLCLQGHPAKAEKLHHLLSAPDSPVCHLRRERAHPSA